MKHQRVLNRPMFNRNNSAYGRGIASNLVSEEERQRFNAGGRVGLKYGSEYLMKIPFAQKIIKKLTPDKSYGKWLTDKIGGTTAPGFGSKDIGTGKAILGAGKKAFKWAGKKLYDRPATIGLPVVGGAWGLSKIFGGKDEDLGGGGKKDGDWADKLQTKPMETEQLDVEEVADWTPKEKAEKKRDMALMMAERLIGGSRDKWGSKAQMENIAGGLGDIRKITDKEDLRKWQRRYDAQAEANIKLDESRHERATSYGAALAAGADHPQALRATTGISGALTMSADPDLREDQKKQIEKRGPGTIFFDEISNSWHILTPDGSIKVTIDQIQEAFKTGKIDEMRKPPEEKEVIEEKVVEQTEPGTIKFDPNNVQIMRN